ncbi:MAG TPA: hypothetical protein VLZ89_09980 [Anaerolineales bacterium]|nr:hypothetical protein [Anaerolineales bacterium]
MDDTRALLNEIFVPADLDLAREGDQLIAYANHGSRFEVSIHPMTGLVLQQMDGKKRLQTVLEIVSSESGLEAEQMRQEVLANILELLKFGMILPSTFMPHGGALRPGAEMPLSSDAIRTRTEEVQFHE